MHYDNTLSLVRGLPGSGKSTFAKRHFPGVLHLENDMYHYHNGVYTFDESKVTDGINFLTDIVKKAMSAKIDVVISNTFCRARTIDWYKSFCPAYTKFVVYRMTGKFENVHDVPADVLSSMKDSFEPYPDELFVQVGNVLTNQQAGNDNLYIIY